MVIPDRVCDERASQDDHPEAEESAAGDASQIALREPELASPVTEDAASDAEADAGGQNGHESRE